MKTTVKVFPLGGEPYETEAPTKEEDGETYVPFEWLYKTIGCDTVQLIHVEGGVLYLDEEGKFKRPCVPNAHANKNYGHLLLPGDRLVGVCVFVPEKG